MSRPRTALCAVTMLMVPALAALHGVVEGRHASVPQVGEVKLSEKGLRGVAATQILPDYPAASVKTGAKGVAVADLVVEIDGRVIEASVLEAPDEPIRAAVLAAVRKWTFTQVQVAGQSERYRLRGKLTFYFEIVDGKGQVQHPEEIIRSGAKKPAATPDVRPGGAPSKNPLPPPPPPPVRSAATHEVPVPEIDQKTWRSQTPSPVVVDIGDRDSFKRGHLPEAINIPLDELPARAARELSKSAALAVDCTQEARDKCRSAALTLLRQGFERIVIIVR